MKKFLIVFCLLFFIFCTYLNLNNDKFYQYFKNFNVSSFCYIVDSQCLDNNNSLNQVVSTAGYDFLYFNSINSNIKAKYKQVEMVYSKGVIKKIIEDLNLRIVFEEDVIQLHIIYAYSPFFDKFVLVKNNRVNFQFALSTDKLTIGYPLIYTSY